MTKEKVQNKVDNPMAKEKVQTIQWLKKRYKIKYRFCPFYLVIGSPVLYFVLFLWALDCLYFMLYFFFGHWIVCTLFCTFSLAIGLSVLYFVLFLW
jgi:hypothetical protein